MICRSGCCFFLDFPKPGTTSPAQSHRLEGHLGHLWAAQYHEISYGPCCSKAISQLLNASYASSCALSLVRGLRTSCCTSDEPEADTPRCYACPFDARKKRPTRIRAVQNVSPYFHALHLRRVRQGPAVTLGTSRLGQGLESAPRLFDRSATETCSHLVVVVAAAGVLGWDSSGVPA